MSQIIFHNKFGFKAKNIQLWIQSLSYYLKSCQDKSWKGDTIQLSGGGLDGNFYSMTTILSFRSVLLLVLFTEKRGLLVQFWESKYQNFKLKQEVYITNSKKCPQLKLKRQINRSRLNSQKLPSLHIWYNSQTFFHNFHR